MLIKNHNGENLWTLKGIVSVAFFNDLGQCDVEKYALFTNVIRFTSWYTSIVESHAAEGQTDNEIYENEFQRVE